MKRCPTCNGTGTVSYPQMRWDEQMGDNIPIETPEQCPDCNGEGEVSERERRQLIREINADTDYEERKLNEK